MVRRNSKNALLVRNRRRQDPGQARRTHEQRRDAGGKHPTQFHSGGDDDVRPPARPASRGVAGRRSGVAPLLDPTRAFPGVRASSRPGNRPAVSFPTAVSAGPPRIMPNRADLEKLRPGYIDAVRAELRAMLEVIPAKELAIQWDCSTELQDVSGRIDGLPAAGAIARNLPQIHALSHYLPADVALGFHLCFGPPP